MAAAGWPVYALALRGHRGGRPADLNQITMDDYREDVALAVAQYLEEALGGWQRPPL